MTDREKIISLLDQYPDAASTIRQRIMADLGEAIVVGELQKRGIGCKLCSGGKRKAVDIVLDDGRTVQVKTSRNDHRIVTRYFQNTKHADFWVLLLVTEPPRFFVLTRDKIRKLQYKRNHPKMSLEEYEKKPRKGVDNLLVSSVLKFEERWDTFNGHRMGTGTKGRS